MENKISFVHQNQIILAIYSEFYYNQMCMTMCLYMIMYNIHLEKK